MRLGKVGGGRARGVLAVWLWYERLTTGRHAGTAGPSGILHWRVARYGGPARRLADGTSVRPGDPVVEVHMDNRALATRFRDGQTSWDVLEATRHDFRAVAAQARSGELGGARAVHGHTMLVVACRRVGFEVVPMRPGPRARLQRFFFVGLYAVYNLRGWRGAERLRREGWPAEVWMSVERLVERYGDR